jgi:hypothetical protein
MKQRIDYSRATPQERQRAMSKARSAQKRAEESARTAAEIDAKIAEARHATSRKYE